MTTVMGGSLFSSICKRFRVAYVKYAVSCSLVVRFVLYIPGVHNILKKQNKSILILKLPTYEFIFNFSLHTAGVVIYTTLIVSL